MLADLAQPNLRVTRSRFGVAFARTAFRTARSGALWGVLFGAIVASSAVSYTKIYATPADRRALATAFGSNHATAALFGPATDLQTVAGFTVFKSFMTIMILGSLWGLLTATRLLRGEEEAGRWELVLAGDATARRATLEALGGLGVGVAALWAVTAVITVGTGRDANVGIATGPSLYFALAQVATAVMFVGVGALTSQLAVTRRQAAALAGWFLGASYALRMVADAGVGLHGLIWATPLGWAEELQPLTSPNPLALLPIAGFTAAAGILAVHLAGTRDVGGSTLPDRSHAPARVRLLFGDVGLTVRLVRPVVIGWLGALGVTGLVLGLIAKQAGGTIAGSSVQQVIDRLGASGAGAEAFLGVAFLIVAVLTAFMAAGQATAARTEEAEGRLDHLLAGPVHRLSWLGGRVLVATAALVVGGAVAGTFTWLGAAAQGTVVSFGTLLGAGINVVPQALCILGLGVLVLGVWPRGTSIVVYGVLGWSLLIELVGGLGDGRRWLLDTSLFHQMAAAPSVSPNWTVDGVMIALGAAAAALGALGFVHRDVTGA